MKDNKKRILGILIILILICILISILLIGEITNSSKDKQRYSIFFGNKIDNNIENGIDNNTINDNTINSRNNSNEEDNIRENMNRTNSVTTTNNGSQNNDNSNNGNNDNNGNNNDHGNKDNDDKDDEPEYDKIILVKSENKIWRENTELNIFANKEFNNQNIIAPESKGQYKFIIENKNQNSSPILCNIEYSEINEKNINMLYKIKINGEYIDNAQWKKIDEFKIENLEIKDNATCTLEWRWADAPNDTEIGESSYADYKLGISITGIAN